MSARGVKEPRGDKRPGPARTEAFTLALLDAQNEIIDAVAAGVELGETLDKIALIVERLAPPAICSIHLLDPDGIHVRRGGAPSLPEDFNKAIDGAEIGPNSTGGGLTALFSERVIVEDIATDPMWAGFQHLALPLGLRACWSQPVIDDHGTALGTFALYYREARAPGEADLDLVDRLARLVRVALVHDRREKALIETEQKLRDFLAVSSDWLWEQDTERRLTFISSNIAGIDPETLLGWASWDSVIKGMSPEQTATYDADMRAERPFRDMRVLQTSPSGEVHHLSINGMPIYDADGRFRGYRGTAHDITRQVAAEAESRRSKIEAEDANRAKTEFLANISHELRTPLNAILGFSELMKDSLLGPLPERYQQYAVDIHTSGQYLHGLVTNILDLSRIEMGRMSLEEEAVDIAEMVHGSAGMLRIRAEAQSIALTVDLPDGLPSVRCDRLRLKQALVNLMTNAVKFSPGGGRVVVSARQTGDGLVLSVSDTGIGMRPEDIPRALEAFRQIEPQLSRRHDGVGLGLALTKSLVELHGGRLELVSKLGQGTTASILIPADRIARD